MLSSENECTSLYTTTYTHKALCINIFYIRSFIFIKLIKNNHNEELSNANNSHSLKKKRHALFVKDVHRMSFNACMLICFQLPSCLQGKNHQSKANLTYFTKGKLKWNVLYSLLTKDFNIKEVCEYNVIPVHLLTPFNETVIETQLKIYIKTIQNSIGLTKSHILVTCQIVNTLPIPILVILKYLSNYIHYLKICIIAF